MDETRIGRRARLAWDGSEKLRFLVVGAWNTAFGYLAFVVAYFLLRQWLHYLVIMLIAHFVSVCNAFVGHKFLVFRRDGHLLADFLRFNMSYVGTLLFGLAALPILVEVFGIHLLISQGLLVVVTTVSSYFLHKKLSFRRRQ